MIDDSSFRFPSAENPQSTQKKFTMKSFGRELLIYYFQINYFSLSFELLFLNTLHNASLSEV